MSSEEISLWVSVRTKRGFFPLTRSCWNVIQHQSVSALISAEQQQPLLGPNAPPRLWSSPVPQSVVWFLKKCVPACAWGKYFRNILEASGMDKCFFSTAGLLSLDFCFGGFWFVFCCFFCHELLHMLSRPAAKPNETRTQPRGSAQLSKMQRCCATIEEISVLCPHKKYILYIFTDLSIVLISDRGSLAGEFS